MPSPPLDFEWTDRQQLIVAVRNGRKRRGLSQAALAAIAGTNRSAIAHLEQGLRLPSLRALTSIADTLEITMPPFRAPREATNERLELPAYIVVGGLPGTGKTTLARRLAASLNRQYLPDNVPARAYLKDLSKDSKRWAFETQLSFLINKATQITTALSGGKSIVVDRSLHEDVNIFAEFFFQTNSIDERSQATYRQLAAYFLAAIPEPDLFILCQCNERLRLERLASRNRPDTSINTNKEYNDGIVSLYGKLRVAKISPFCADLDTGIFDTRRPARLKQLAAELSGALTDTSTAQLTLFDGRRVVAENSSRVFKTTQREDFNPPLMQRTPTGKRSKYLGYPLAYIAAPFTGAAISGPPNRAQTRLILESEHGRIGKGAYRTAIERVERELKGLGFFTFLPHRDVNKWGEIEVPPETIYAQCSEQASTCDLFVGLLANSSGSHLEYGLARSAKKPCIILSCTELPDSYLARGIQDVENEVLLLSCEKISEIPDLLRDVRVGQLIASSFEI